MTDASLGGHCSVSVESVHELDDGALDAVGRARPALDFESVYASEFDFVWRRLRRLGVPSTSMDDAAQDVFLVVHRRLADFEARSSVRTWLYGIVEHVASDHRRRFRRKGDLEPLPRAVLDARSGPHELLEHAEKVDLLESVLARLSDERRAVFVLAEIEQISVPEIAEMLGQNLNTTYSRLRLARRDFELALARTKETT